jgi:uncharacterized protein with von Willebrand factor type A (vWA) domain
MSVAPARAQPLEAIAGFAALLREHGLKVGIAEHQAMVQAALALPLSGGAAPGGPVWRESRISAAWRAVACHDLRDWRRWPDLFERYWYPGRLKGTVKVSGQTRPSRDLREVVQQLQQSLDAGGAQPPRPGGPAPDAALDDSPTDGDDPGLSRAQGGASRTEALHDRSLSMWLPQDLAQLEQLADRIAARLRRRLTRRWHDDAHGRRLDLRRTLRASLRTGGVPVQPAWRRPRRERPRLFILVDVSRSMETHAQLFLRIARAFVQAAGARVFVFHTRLAEVTPLLQRDSAAVQEKVNAVTAGFGGGTRIATSLADFVGVHARAQLGRGARVWVLSDGFDADEPHRLAEQLLRVRGRGGRITWFHPNPARPASAAMQACDGLIERFIPLHRLRDLALAVPLLH